MKRLRLSLIRSEILIQSARSLSFTFVMRCHISSPKGKGRNLLISNSVAEIYFPACCLANQNVHRFLKSGHLTTTALSKQDFPNIPMGGLFLKVSYPNIQSTPIYSLYFLEVNEVHTLIWLRLNITQFISKSASSPCANLLKM